MYAAAKGKVGLVCRLAELGVEIEHADKVTWDVMCVRDGGRHA